MMQLIREVHTLDQNGKNLQLQYFLLTVVSKTVCGEMETYGVEVKMIDAEGSVSAVRKWITPIGSRVLALIDCLANATVTPTTVEDVLQDVL